MPPINIETAATKYSKMTATERVAYITAIIIMVLGVVVYFLFFQNTKSVDKLYQQCQTDKDYWRTESERKDSLLEQRRLEYNAKIDYYQHQLQLIHDEANKKVTSNN
jgi:hypothetical protein